MTPPGWGASVRLNNVPWDGVPLTSGSPKIYKLYSNVLSAAQDVDIELLRSMALGGKRRRVVDSLGVSSGNNEWLGIPLIDNPYHADSTPQPVVATITDSNKL